ncbi:MAG: hypothetical protein U9R37_02930 [Campylobacterota bacterium]|nr:hypothetical protein [Campylobacterota bacterium]
MKKFKSFFYILVISLFITPVLANENGVDCLILEDENSIICKYTQERVDYEKVITIEWIEPTNNVTRTRQMTIPAFHGSVYDYRYKSGRTQGTWTFKVIDGEKEYSTNFTIE